MFNSPIDEIKNRLDIVEVIGSYIKLQKAGVNYRAICPFHSEKKPSFFVSPSRQIWHCFGCGKGGDIFKFVMEIEGVEFGDALRILAQKAGVELKEYRPEWKTKRKKLYDISELAAKFFQKQLKASSAGKRAREYLLSRGITEESIEKWRLGWAPEQGRALLDFLISKGYEKEDISSAGLAVRTEGGKFYDRFRSRIIFPIFDFNSQVIGFGGRIFGEREKEEVAKYINTPATPLYDKSKVIYGLDKARVKIRKKDFCIIVEGYVDAILVSQAGFENVVAVSGTALTVYHLKILSRYTNRLYLSFDMDIGGETATKRGIDLTQKLGFDIKIIEMPEGKDPADVVKENPDEWKKLVEEAKDIMDFYFDNAFSSFDKNSPDGKRRIAAILLPVIKRIPNKIVQSHWIQKLASNLEAKEEDIREELEKIKEDRTGERLPPLEEKKESKKLSPKTRKEMLEERILALLLKKPELLDYMKEDFNPYFSEKSLKVILLLKKAIEKEKVSRENLLKKIEELQKDYGFEDSEFLDYLILKSEVEFPEDKDLEKEIEICLKGIKDYKLKQELSDLSSEIRISEEKKDSSKVAELLKKFNDLSKRLFEE